MYAHTEKFHLLGKLANALNINILLITNRGDQYNMFSIKYNIKNGATTYYTWRQWLPLEVRACSVRTHKGECTYMEAHPSRPHTANLRHRTPCCHPSAQLPVRVLRSTHTDSTEPGWINVWVVFYTNPSYPCKMHVGQELAVQFGCRFEMMGKGRWTGASSCFICLGTHLPQSMLPHPGAESYLLMAKALRSRERPCSLIMWSFWVLFICFAFLQQCGSKSGPHSSIAKSSECLPDIWDCTGWGNASWDKSQTGPTTQKGHDLQWVAPKHVHLAVFL